MSNERRAGDREGVEMEAAEGRSSAWATETVADGLPDMVARFGPDLRLTYANRALQRAAGAPLETLLGQAVDSSSIGMPFAPRLVDALRTSADSGEEVLLELRQGDDPGARWLEIRVVPEHGLDGAVSSLLTICRDTTRRHEEETARRRAEELVREAAEGIPGFLTRVRVDPRTTPPTLLVEYIGSGIRELAGRDPETITRFVDSLSVVHPDDRETWLRDRIATARGGAGTYEYRFLRPDGTIRWVRERLRAMPQPDGTILCLSVVVDITNEREADAAARAALAQVRAIEEYLPGFLFRASRPVEVPDVLTVEYVGPGFQRVLGYSSDEVAGLASVFALFHPETPGTPGRVWGHVAEALDAGGALEHDVEVRLLAKDGSSVWMQGPVRLAPEEGRVVITGLLFDVTERRRTEEALANVEKLEGLRVLAGGVAHDFANLLAVVRGNADLALAELPPDAPTAESIRNIAGAAAHASALTRQLMAYAGRESLAVEPVDLATLVEGMRSLLVTTVAGAAALDFALADDAPTVLADRTQLSQVILNLVVNAAEATVGRDGTVTVGCFPATLDRRALDAMTLGESCAAGRFAVLEVRDTGRGMDEDTMRRIFDPFFSTKTDGRGLGLASVLGIVRGHHGAISVASIPGGGTRIGVALPASACEVPAGLDGAHA